MQKRTLLHRILRTIKRLGALQWLMQLTKPFIPKLLLLVMLGVVTILIGIVSSIASKYVIDAAAGALSMKLSITIMIALAALSLILGLVSSLVTNIINEKYAFHIRRKLFDRILNTYWFDITKYHSGDLLTRLKGDIAQVTGGVTDVLPQIITLSVQLIAAFFTLFHFDKMIALFALILGPVSVLAMFGFGGKLKRLQTKVQQTESQYSSFLQESIENIMIVKSFSAEARHSQRLQELFLERLSWVFKRSKMSAIASSAMGLVFSAGYLTAFIYSAYRISQGQITYGTMTVFLTLVAQVQGPFLSLARTFPQMISILASSERISEILNLEQEEREPLTRSVAAVGIEFKDIDFKYQDDAVFQHAALRINPGDTVAIIGPSGIGKTTLVRLIMAFIKPQAGEVLCTMDDSDTVNIGPAVRQFIDYVPQGNTMFSGTIADNLRMGKPSATEEEMIRVLQLSAAEFVLDFPEKLNTMIGERGHRLSEGQAQRLAIARALIRNSPLLILDEATSALDEATERRILQSFERLAHKPTCIVITHRKSILAFCNRTIEIDQGKLIEA